MGKSKFLFVALLSFVGSMAVGDPPPSAKNLWRNTNYFNHYVLYDKPTNSYIETVNCKAAWRFTKIGESLNEIILRDAGRKLNMKINYDGMWLKADSDADYKFYQKGTFDKRVRFFHEYNGQWTGTLSRKHGCAWEELLAGSSKPNFFFNVYAQDANQVYLYDGSRDMRVRLGLTDMYLQAKGATQFGFFKKGRWSEY